MVTNELYNKMTYKEDMWFQRRLSLWDCQGSGVSAHYEFKHSMAPNSPWISPCAKGNLIHQSKHKEYKKRAWKPNNHHNDTDKIALLVRVQGVNIWLSRILHGPLYIFVFMNKQTIDKKIPSIQILSEKQAYNSKPIYFLSPL